MGWWPVWSTVLLLCHLLLVSISPSGQAGVGSRTAESGDGAAVIHRLRAAAKGQPNSPLAHLQLALALHELNHQTPDGGSRVPEAEQEYRKALSLINAEGEHASIYIHVQGNLGALLLSADRAADAITELQGALKLGETLQQQLKQHAKKLKKQPRDTEQQQQQQALLQQTQEVEKQLGGLLFNLGKALTAVGRLADADQVYLQAATAAYGRDFASYGKALAAMHSMPDDVSKKASQTCQAAAQHFSAKDNLAFIKDVQPPHPTATKTSAAAAEDHLPHSEARLGDWIQQADSVDLVWLHFALYKYYHSSKDYKVAWHYLQLGNRIMAAHVAYDAVRDQRNHLNIKSIFRAPFVTSGMEDRTPIFVVGMPRSGSTLVEQMLASHSQVFAAGEDTALAPLTPAINKALATSAPAELPNVLQHFGEKYLSTMRAKVPSDWAAKKRRLSASSSSSSEPARIVDKMLRNLWLVGYIHMLLPKACIVHVVRHPMDVALSCYAQPFGYSASALAWSWDLSAIASQLQMVWDLAEHWEQQLPGRVHTVFYEELVERPEAVATELLSVCGLPWEPGVLNFHDTDRPVHTASMEQVRQPLYKTSVQRWKAYRQQLEPLREAVAPLIARYEQLLHQRMSATAAATMSAEQVDDTDDDSSELAKDEL